MLYKKVPNAGLDPTSYVEDVAGAIMDAGRAKDTVLGLPLYAIDWYHGKGTALKWSDIGALTDDPGQTTADADDALWKWTAGGHVVWYSDGYGARVRAQIAERDGLLGIGFWRLGQEDVFSFWTQLGHLR